MLSKTSNNISIQEIFASIDISLKEAAEIKTFESCQLIAERLVALLKIPDEINRTELLISDKVLQKRDNDAWTHKAPKYSDRKAYYQLAQENERNIDFKLFWAKKSNRRTISNLVHRVTSNYEDDELLYADENLGIDFIVPDKADRLIIALSSNYKIRTLELHKALTNTQKQIFEKWYNSPEDTHKKTLHQILWDSFDIHPLNKEFYRNIAELFTREVQHLVTNKILDEYTAKQFTTRLIGRIIFCWFLRKKNIIAEEFNYFEAKSLTATEFYHKKLEILFFDVLNTPQNERNNLDRKTPFLNGGLFEPRKHDYYREKKVFFPDDYFIDFFYDFLDKYNFTTDESSSDFQQVAIDPEMLGRIFENLLAEQSNETGEQARKAKGAFYTPREIVDYMCRESLRLYLAEKLGEDSRKEKILNLLLDKKEHEFDYKNDRAELNPYKARLIEALDNLKIIDPACGSGAFPMGILQILVNTYARLDGRLDSYKTKKGIISENIYGVDMEPTAIEISRLRVWLSLVVDIELKNSADNSGIEPLPNLDFKFICANSLISLKENSQLSLFDDAEFEKSLKSLQEQYFTSKPSEKKKLQGEFQKLLGRNIFNSNRTGISERQQQLESYQPFDSESVCGFFDTHFMFTLDGFDIVIGNPPYVQLQKLKKNPLQELYKKASYQTYDSSGDLYCLFYEHAVNMLKSNGHLSYITSNKWMRANYGHRLRNFFIKYNPLRLIDLGPAVFESATVDTNILFLQKKPNTSISLSATQYKKSDLPLIDFINQNSIILNKPNAEAWFIGNDAEYKLKQKIEKLGKPLGEWDIRINYGIKTGLNEAFIINQNTKEELCNLDPKNNEILKPILRGKDIKKYHYQWANLWLISTGFDKNIEKDFPIIYKYLLKFKEKAKHREDQGKAWYNLRACSYYDDFSKEKIIWQEMSQKPCFAYDCKEIFCVDTARILTGEHLKFFLGLFNSHFFLYTFSQWYAGGGLGRKGIRFKSDFMKKYPIPKPKNQSTIKNIETLVDKILSRTEKEGYHEDKKLQSEVHELESEIDKLIYKLYELNPEEISLIEEASKDS
jgi:methylase of polypeptide subunit release factors